MIVRLLPSWIFHFAAKDTAPEPMPVPEDLSGLSAEELDALAADLDERFKVAQASGDTDGWSPESIEAFEAMASEIQRVEAEKTSRTTANEELANRAAAAVASVTPTEPQEPEAPEGGEPETVAAGAEQTESLTAELASAPGVTLSEDQFIQLLERVTPGGSSVDGEELVASARTTEPARARRRGLNDRLRLSEVQRRAPSVDAPERPDVVITAAADIRGFQAGGQVDADPKTLARMMHARALGLPADHSGNAPVATIHRTFDHELSEDSTPEQVWEVVEKATDPQLLVAAGGWCAPSEILYDLFNIAESQGMVDLPTTGVSRGGIRFPVSPSIADIFGGTVPWTWTEANDIAALTGGGTKPCIRVSCPTFHEDRLVCDGLCVTAGNLTERAYPENLANFVELVLAAHFHFMNARFISEMIALSTAVTTDSQSFGVVAPVLASIELGAIDYRERFRMSPTAILEVVLPYWILGEMRADMSRRTGSDLDHLDIADALIGQWFDRRNVRVQFVDDWQVNTTAFPGAAASMPGGATALVEWPATVQFMLYAAGTFIKGGGPTIDLGVVRDSTLNATNDFTAAWTEECNLISRVGHLSRVYTVPICPNGATGSLQTLTCPAV